MYTYLIPVLNLCPPAGFRVDTVLPLGEVRQRVAGDDGRMTVVRITYSDGHVRSTEESPLELRGGEWAVDDGARHNWPCDGPNWDTSDSLACQEIYIRAEGATRFTVRDFPSSFYSVFYGEGRKTYMNDLAIKFADPVQIAQMKAFGSWCVGYPACEVDPARDVDESVALFNPYQRPASVTVELLDATGTPAGTKKARINGLSGKRIAFSSILPRSFMPWSGQMIVTGPNRLVVWVAKHSLASPTRMTTLEHIDSYRGEALKRPFTQAMHARLHDWLRTR